MSNETYHYRWLEQSDLFRIADLDRSEHVTLAYTQEGDALSYEEVDWQVPSWFAQGEGDHSLNHMVAFCQEHLERGGIMRGAFHDELMVGVGILQPDIRPLLDQLAFLHVSSQHRRKGIASELVRELVLYALRKGSRRIYVSATPSKSAVNFYLRYGFKPVAVRLPELDALEPEDIHMVKELQPVSFDPV